MKASYIIFFFWSFAFAALFANGDPVVSISSLTKSANPSPKPIVDIQILKEDLYIQPSQNTTVKVKYVLQNSSDKDYNDIDYGFPVDYAGVGTVNAPLASDLITESAYTIGWHDSYIKRMAFFMNSNALPYTMSEETVLKKIDRKEFKEEYAEFFDESDTLIDTEIEDEALTRDIARRWFYTKFSIKAGETCVLEVEYTLQNSFSIPLYSLNTIIQSSSETTGWGSFYYDMSPAQHWGDGTAKELSVEIDFANTAHLQREIYNNDNLSPVSDLLFTEKGKKLICKAQNFNFKNAAPIQLEYYSTYNSNYQDLLKHRIDPSAYTIVASDELDAYPVSNLSDLDMSTAWAVKPKERQKTQLKIVFDKPTLPGAIIVVGGYHKSVDTFKNNAQPKTISIDLDKNDGIQYLYGVNKNLDEQINTYKGISDKNILDLSLIYTPPMFSETYSKPQKEITLTIEDVYPGEKFDDLCISEIIIVKPNYVPRF